MKKIVNGIVDTLTEETMVAECYRKWQECQNEVYRTYKDTIPEYPPLSGQKEFKSIKNMVISEAVKLGNGSFILMMPDMNRGKIISGWRQHSRQERK